MGKQSTVRIATSSLNCSSRCYFLGEPEEFQKLFTVCMCSCFKTGVHAEALLLLWELTGFFLCLLAKEQRLRQQCSRRESGLCGGWPTEDPCSEKHPGSLDRWAAIHRVWNTSQECEMKRPLWCVWTKEDWTVKRNSAWPEITWPFYSR